MKSKQPVHRVVRGLWIGLAVVGISAVIVACSMLQRPQAEHQALQAAASSDEAQTTPARVKKAATPEQTKIVAVDDSEAVFQSKIDAHRNRINELGGDYPARIEARRVLLGQLLRRGPLDNILPEFAALLDDVDRMEGQEMARRVAFSEAGTWQIDERYDAAILAHQYIIDTYPESGFAVESLYHLGECRIELQQYAEAEQVFQKLIEEHDDSPMAGWGWRKLALSQLLQGRFDECLATLDLMSAKFDEGELGEYARARSGYVLMVAGRKVDAKKAYESFLAACPASKYCRLVQQQMLELDKLNVIANARSRETQ